MKRYLIILILIFPSVCFADWFVVRDGSADFKFDPPGDDPSVIGYIVKIKEGVIGTYDDYINIKSTDPLEFSYTYEKRKTIRIRIYSYNSIGMESQGCLKGTIRLTSSKPPEKLDVK